MCFTVSPAQQKPHYTFGEMNERRCLWTAIGVARGRASSTSWEQRSSLGMTSASFLQGLWNYKTGRVEVNLWGVRDRTARWTSGNDRSPGETVGITSQEELRSLASHVRSAVATTTNSPHIHPAPALARLRARARGVGAEMALRPRVRAASGKRWEWSGRLEPGAGRGPGLSVRRAAGGGGGSAGGFRLQGPGRSGGWVSPQVSARASAQVFPSPTPVPFPFFPNLLPHPAPSRGSRAAPSVLFLPYPPSPALVSPSPVRGSRRHDPAGGEQPHHRGDARAQVRERGRRVSAPWGPVGGGGGELALMIVQSSRTHRREVGDPAGCGDCPGGVRRGGDWARWGEGQRCVGRRLRGGMRRKQSGQECACQRSGDLWDVRGAWAGTSAEDLIALERAGDHFPLYSPSLLRTQRKPISLGFGIRLEGEFSGIPITGGKEGGSPRFTTHLLAPHPHLLF